MQARISAKPISAYAVGLAFSVPTTVTYMRVARLHTHCEAPSFSS